MSNTDHTVIGVTAVACYGLMTGTIAYLLIVSKWEDVLYGLVAILVFCIIALTYSIHFLVTEIKKIKKVSHE